jgi:rod shape-determining protein MreC
MRFIYTKTFTRLFTIFVIVALIAILDIAGILSPVKSGFFHSYSAISGLVSNTTFGIKNTVGVFGSIKSIVHENAELEIRVQELSFENARLKSSQDENISLRRALNFKLQSSLNLESAELLTADPTGFGQSITLDKGSNDGVLLNQPVVVAPGILVAKITKVYGGTSEATLITDPSVIVNAEVVDSGAKGLIRGEHGLTMLLDLVTQNDLVKSGDRVITSGLSGDFPRGLLIGQVSALRSKDTDLFQKAYVSSSADLRNLRFLYIVK